MVRTVHAEDFDLVCYDSQTSELLHVDDLLQLKFYKLLADISSTHTPLQKQTF